MKLFKPICFRDNVFSAHPPADHSVAVERGGCFPGWARVTLAGGRQKTLSSLAPGDRVMALSDTGQVVYTRVLSFLHQDQESVSTFLSLETEEGYTLVLTPHHLVFLAPNCGHDISEYQARFASRAKTGDCVLISTADSQTLPSPIVSVSVAESVGVYAPLTEAGTLFVDRVLASSYALVEDHRLAHWAFGPLRLFYSLKELLWAEAADQTTTGSISLTNIRSHFSTLTIKKEGINEGFLHKHNNLTEPFRMKIQEKRLSKIHWYARLLYRFAWVLLDSNLFYP